MGWERRRGAVVELGVHLGYVRQLFCFAAWSPGLVRGDVPVSLELPASFILLLLVVGASTGAAAVVVWVGALLELGVASGCARCFFFLRRLKRLRRPLLTWAKASSAMSEK